MRKGGEEIILKDTLGWKWVTFCSDIFDRSANWMKNASSGREKKEMLEKPKGRRRKLSNALWSEIIEILLLKFERCSFFS